MSLASHDLAQASPSALDIPPRQQRLRLTGFDRYDTSLELPNDIFDTSPHVHRSATTVRTIDTVELTGSTLPSDRAFRRVWFNAVLAQSAAWSRQ
jgi:hypothetical protein